VGSDPRAGLHAAELWCEQCARLTPHRIVHWDRRGRKAAGRRGGLARCRACGLTHPFEVRPVREHEFDLIVSRGATSERSRVRRPAGERVATGSLLSGAEPPLTIHRLVRPGGDSVAMARISELASLWAVPADERRLPISIVDGARTRSGHWVVDPAATIALGQELELDGVPVRVVALRANGRTWRFGEVRFPAREVQRVYGRRTVSPPAGRSDWSRGRGTESSRASSTSRWARSRSSPGVRRTRTSPRRRSAAGGATVQRIAPS